MKPRTIATTVLAALLAGCASTQPTPYPWRLPNGQIVDARTSDVRPPLRAGDRDPECAGAQAWEIPVLYANPQAPYTDMRELARIPCCRIDACLLEWGRLDDERQAVARGGE